MFSGPFADSSKARPRPIDQRPPDWDYDALFSDPERAEQMYDVGRKGRDKERARMRNQQRDDERHGNGGDDWFERNMERAREVGRNRRRSAERDDRHRRDRRRNGKPDIEFLIQGEALRLPRDAEYLADEPPVAPLSLRDRIRHTSRREDRYNHGNEVNGRHRDRDRGLETGKNYGGGRNDYRSRRYFQSERSHSRYHGGYGR